MVLFWFCVIILIATFIALVVAIYLAKAEIDAEGISLDEMDGVDVNSATKGFKCCDHCFDSNGMLTHPYEMLDSHTVPCFELVGKYRCQGFEL